MAYVCELTVKFNAKDESKTHTRTFTSFDGDWTRVHEKVREYTAKHFGEDDLLSVSYLNHASYEMRDLA